MASKPSAARSHCPALPYIPSSMLKVTKVSRTLLASTMSSRASARSTCRLRASACNSCAVPDSQSVSQSV
eukprot:8545211-Pyramimonas_sp.AAC.1